MEIACRVRASASLVSSCSLILILTVCILCSTSILLHISLIRFYLYDDCAEFGRRQCYGWIARTPTHTLRIHCSASRPVGTRETHNRTHCSRVHCTMYSTFTVHRRVKNFGPLPLLQYNEYSTVSQVSQSARGSHLNATRAAQVYGYSTVNGCTSKSTWLLTGAALHCSALHCAGYFLHDLLDMMTNDRSRGLAELLLHHTMVCSVRVQYSTVQYFWFIVLYILF